jgi:glycosyltransferase involved in cell wall biosynthesis
MEKIRILHCLETVGSGGVEQLRYNLARYMDKDIFEQKIVCTWAVGVLPDKFDTEGVQVIPIGDLRSPFHIQQYRKVMKIIREYKPHLVHGAVFEGVSLATVAGKMAGTPGVIIEETSDPADRNWKGNMLMRLYGRWADKVVAVSEAGGEYIRSVLKVVEPKLQVIPNGVATPLYPDSAATAALKTALGISGDDFVVGSVGRLFDDHKKFSDLIKAVSLLGDRCPGLKLLIVGDGPDADKLKALCSGLGLDKRVIFVGYQGDTAPYYACMDLFALASQREAFGLVLVEAMFFRLAVVATAVGGIKNVVLDKETGLLVDKNAPAALAEGIYQLYADPERREAFGQAGYSRAETEFSIATYIQRMTGLYTDLVQKKGIRS